MADPLVQEAFPEMRLALVQQACSIDRAANLELALTNISTAGRAGADVVVFAELAVDLFFPQHAHPTNHLPAEPIPGPTSDRIAAAAAKNNVVVVFNMYEESGGRFFDSSPVFDSDGSLLGVTRMVHITDYACFHETAYYAPGNTGAPVYDTTAGKIGVAICYDRHYPEYMRALGVAGAELVVIPQAGAIGEWPADVYEAEVQAAAFQNGYFAALCNRTGEEEKLTFAGESFVVDPSGVVRCRAEKQKDQILMQEIDLSECKESAARQLFWRDRRPELYRDWLG